MSVTEYVAKQKAAQKRSLGQALEAFYRSDPSVGDIERIEGFVATFGTATKDGTLMARVAAFGDLEKKAAAAEPVDDKPTPAGNEKPVLTYDVYKELRNAGQDHAKMLETYSVAAPKVMGAFSANYTRYELGGSETTSKKKKKAAKKKKKPTETKQPAKDESSKGGVRDTDKSAGPARADGPVQDNRPILESYTLYAIARRSGNTHDEITEHHSFATDRTAGAWRAKFDRDELNRE